MRQRPITLKVAAAQLFEDQGYILSESARWALNPR